MGTRRARAPPDRTGQRRSRASTGSPPGTVALIILSAEARDLIRAVHDVRRPRQPGEIWRRDISWDLGLAADEAWGERWKGWLIVHRDASGTMTGTHATRPIPRGRRTSPRQGRGQAEPRALRGRLRCVTRAVDLWGKIRMEGRRVAEPLPGCSPTSARRTRSLRATHCGCALFDVPRALEARTYERQATLVLEVVDDEAWGGTRRLQLHAGPAGATCLLTDRHPTYVSRSPPSLAGLPGRDPGRADIAIGTGAEEHRPGALARRTRSCARPTSRGAPRSSSPSPRAVSRRSHSAMVD